MLLEYGILAFAGLAIFITAGVLSIETDSMLMSVATIIIGALTLQFGFNIAIWSFVAANFILLMSLLFLYAGVGAVYTAIWRWPEYIRMNKVHVMHNYTTWSRLRPKTGSDNSFDTFLNSDAYEFNAGSHKERLANWVIMWPFSMSWEIARKPTKWIYKTLFSVLGDMFQSISHRTARNIHNKEGK